MELFLVVWIGGAIITGMIASNRGHAFIPWFIFGLLLLVVALPCALLLRPNQAVLDKTAINSGASKKCPHCAEVIRREANVCRFCGRDVAASPWPAERAP